MEGTKYNVLFTRITTYSEVYGNMAPSYTATFKSYQNGYIPIPAVEALSENDCVNENNYERPSWIRRNRFAILLVTMCCVVATTMMSLDYVVDNTPSGEVSLLGQRLMDADVLLSKSHHKEKHHDRDNHDDDDYDSHSKTHTHTHARSDDDGYDHSHSTHPHHHHKHTRSHKRNDNYNSTRTYDADDDSHFVDKSPDQYNTSNPDRVMNVTTPNITERIEHETQHQNSNETVTANEHHEPDRKHDDKKHEKHHQNTNVTSSVNEKHNPDGKGDERNVDKNSSRVAATSIIDKNAKGATPAGGGNRSSAAVANSVSTVTFACVLATLFVLAKL